MKLSAAKIEEWKSQHIPYRMLMLDAFRWWCAFRMSRKDHRSIRMILNDKPVDALLLTNGVTESGLMACRFLLYFIGLTSRAADASPTGYDLKMIQHGRASDDDVWAERIGCKSASLDDLTLDERHACGYTHKRASQGVGHPTDGPEGVTLTWLMTGANAIERAIIESVYSGKDPVVRSPLWVLDPNG